MNIYTVALLGMLLIVRVLDTVVELLNIKNIRLTVPTEFRKVYKPKAYKNSQKYLKEDTVFQLVESWISFVIFGVFVLLGGFNFVDLLARSASDLEIVRGLLFAGILFLGSTLLQVPFSLYDTFVIEEKYGFNKTSLRTFILDLVKNLLLSIVVGGFVYSLVLFFFQIFSLSAWLIAWVFVCVFQLFLLFIAPVVIMPLFNKFTPLPAGKLKKSIEEFARKENFTLEGIFTMDSSKRSTKSNAFFTGFGKYRRIVLFDTLIKSLSVSELVSVLAHEIGHYKKGHIIKRIAYSFLLTGVSLFAISALINNPFIFNAFNMQNTSIYASFILVAIIAAPAFLVSGFISNAISRSFEFEADQFAVKRYKNPNAFINALKKLTVNNLANLYPHPWKVIWEYSHPPILQRIEAIKKVKV